MIEIRYHIDEDMMLRLYDIAEFYCENENFFRERYIYVLNLFFNERIKEITLSILPRGSSRDVFIPYVHCFYDRLSVNENIAQFIIKTNNTMDQILECYA